VLKYCVGTKGRGFKIKPNSQWNGKEKVLEFEIEGMPDSDFTKDINT
jgi:hypothetical protein